MTIKQKTISLWTFYAVGEFFSQNQRRKWRMVKTRWLKNPRCVTLLFCSPFELEGYAFLQHKCRCGGMVDAVDSKSTLGNQVLVRVRPSAFLYNPRYFLSFFSGCRSIPYIPNLPTLRAQDR
jgi:hypothetical protein